MKRWHRVKQPDPTRVQKLLADFVSKVEPLKKQLEEEARRMADAIEAQKGGQ